MATKTKNETPTPVSAPAEITLDGLISNATEGEERAKAMLHQQIGVKLFVESLKKEGYDIVKIDK